MVRSSTFETAEIGIGWCIVFHVLCWRGDARRRIGRNEIGRMFILETKTNNIAILGQLMNQETVHGTFKLWDRKK